MKQSLAWLVLLCSPICWSSYSLEPLLNKINLQFNAEQWITTKTALVNISVDAAVTDKGIERIQNEVMSKLKQFSSQEWHILSFDRQQDKSGLESVHLVAQARLLQNDLANLRERAKAMSKPGETYTIDTIQFTPNEEEIKAANVIMRNQIYQQAKTEIETLNKTYPEQHYYLHQIDFITQTPPAPMLFAAKAAVLSPKVNDLNVGNKGMLQANVILAAMHPLMQQQLQQAKTTSP